MSEPIDALVYASIKNNLTTQQLSDAGMTSRFTVPSGSTLPRFMNDILSNTTIKKACCLKSGRDGNTDDKFSVRVKIPVPKNYNFNDASEPDIWKKFGYIEKTVNVPKTMCTAPTLDVTYGYNEDICQKFMPLYCENVKNFYKDELESIGKKPDPTEFAKYSPECACYADRPKYLQKGGALPAICFADGCDTSNNNVFIDTASRKPCSVTICQSNLDLDSLKAGGNVNVNSKVTQQCGNQLNQPDAPAGGAPAGGGAGGGAGGAPAGGAGGAPAGGATASNAASGSTTTGGSAGGAAAKTDTSGDKIMGMPKNTFYGVAGGGICLCIILIIIIVVVLRKK